eukprot:CAMPEP_0184707604 /NCGR_PEP_ID=MMETSP0313-20130426/37356_1 /TAXON_ID=2792 /ORGANISM="Porphyridium aerugineum, Strain SAG 1380-2" /LENGTH=765 /DNA_ID=CAMNT_0027169183 /DNA_START=58 /DNA_END=2354 /DNA_ORIENTATION=+
MPDYYPAYKYNESFMDEARSEAKQIVMDQKRKTSFNIENTIKRLMGPTQSEEVPVFKSPAARKIDFHKEARDSGTVVGPQAAGQGNGKLPKAPGDPPRSADMEDDSTESVRDDDHDDADLDKVTRAVTKSPLDSTESVRDDDHDDADLDKVTRAVTKSPASKAAAKKEAGPSSSKKRSWSDNESSDEDEEEKIPDKPKRQPSKAASSKPVRSVRKDSDDDGNDDEVVSSDEEARPEGDFNDDVCYKCHFGGTLTCCDGGCFRSWHSDCLPAGAVSENKEFCCNECFTEDWQCWYCQRKLTLKAWKKCEEFGCGRKYHLDCALNLPLTKVVDRNEGVFICPRHVCGMCDEELGWTNKCTRCVQCPISYHRKCLPLGAVLLEAETQFRCARHDEECVKLAARKGRNFEFCVTCKLPMPDNAINEGPCVSESDAVDWIRCSGCLNAYHCKCLPSNLFLLKKAFMTPLWYCGDCVSGKMLRSGDYVWAKAPGYPYWPAKLSDIPPQKLLKSNHDSTDIAVRWYGKKPYEFSWMKNPLLGKYENLNKSTVRDRPVKLLAAFDQIEKAITDGSDDDLPVDKGRKVRAAEERVKKRVPSKEKPKASKLVTSDSEGDSDVHVISVVKKPLSNGKEAKDSKNKDSAANKKRKFGPTITRSEIPAKSGKTVKSDVKRVEPTHTAKVVKSPQTAKAVTLDARRPASGIKHIAESRITPSKRIEESESTQSDDGRSATATEDFCFLCGNGGLLIMCDFPNCPKVYQRNAWKTLASAW